MNYKELRPDNLVLDNGVIRQVLKVGFFECELEHEDRINYYVRTRNLKPVPLHVIIYRLGFNKDKDGCICLPYPGTSCSYYLVDDFISVANGLAVMSNYRHIKNVHQFQNLYYIQVDKELKINI